MLFVALGIIFACGATSAQRIDNVSPTDNIQAVTLVDPAPIWDSIAGTWKLPEGFDPDSDSEANGAKTNSKIGVSVSGNAHVVINGELSGEGLQVPEGFGLPLLAAPEEMTHSQELQGMIVLNAVNSTAAEVANMMGGAVDMEGWSIRSLYHTIYVFPKIVLEEDEKFGAAMNITGEGIIDLYDANGKIIDWVRFPGERPGLVYHRVPDMIGEWQWILGNVIIGSH